MNKSFYVGSYKEDGLKGPNRGWILGNFQDPPIDPPRDSLDVEVKYWAFKAGPTGHKAKESAIIECTLILKGKVKGVINGQEVVLSAGEYFVIKPGVQSNIPTEALEDTEGLTIKAPSDPSAKKLV